MSVLELWLCMTVIPSLQALGTFGGTLAFVFTCVLLLVRWESDISIWWPISAGIVTVILVVLAILCPDQNAMATYIKYYMENLHA